MALGKDFFFSLYVFFVQLLYNFNDESFTEDFADAKHNASAVICSFYNVQLLNDDSDNGHLLVGGRVA